MIAPAEDFRFGGETVRVNWHDQALRAALRPAVAHRAGGDGEPALTIDVVAKEFAGIENRGGLQVQESADALDVVDAARGVATSLHDRSRHGQFTVANPGRLPLAERAAPFRLIFQAWLRAHGAQLLHAGAVALPGRGSVLLVAPGGGGKSNTVLACLEAADFAALGEDFVAVDADATPRVWSLYSGAKLAPADVGRFSGLAGALPAGRDGADGKLLFDLGASPAARFADGVPLRAVLVLRIAGGDASRLAPAAPGEAVKAMLTSLLMVLPGARRSLFEFTTRLLRRVPAYRLELGRDPAQIAGAIRRFLES